MTENNLQQHLYDMLTEAAQAERDDQIDVPQELFSAKEGICHVSTFADEGMLTGNAGLILRTNDRSEFQISIIRSR